MCGDWRPRRVLPTDRWRCMCHSTRFWLQRDFVTWNCDCNILRRPMLFTGSFNSLNGYEVRLCVFRGTYKNRTHAYWFHSAGRGALRRDFEDFAQTQRCRYFITCAGSIQKVSLQTHRECVKNRLRWNSAVHCHLIDHSTWRKHQDVVELEDVNRYSC